MTDATGRAFVVRPFGEKSNAEGESPIDFDMVDQQLIGVALDRVGMMGGTTEEFIQQGNIRADMFRQLLAADLVIADISIHNANAFYELGIRHALRDQYTVLIKSKNRGDPHVFDLKADRYLPYDPDDPGNSVDQLVATIRKTLKNESADSPVFQLLPGLTSFNPAKAVVVPLQFREKIELATTRENVSELMSLSSEIVEEAWNTEGLRIIGRAIFRLGKHQESSQIWERIRAFDMFDPEANQKLATNYQRLDRYKESELAANRALQFVGLRDWDRAETHALIGSNHKSQWLGATRSETDGTKQEHRALQSPYLERAYQAYRKGFECHRSHYYSGLNAVAMLSIQVQLAERHPRQWILEFKSEAHAILELEDRKERLAKLISATDLAIESSIRNYPQDEWAGLSRADLMLLTHPDPERVAYEYAKCNETIKHFSKESLGRQLQIYQDLHLFEDNVVAALDVFPTD